MTQEETTHHKFYTEGLQPITKVGLGTDDEVWNGQELNEPDTKFLR